MKRLIVLSLTMLCCAVFIKAQSNGSVSIKQSAEIDALVYGKKKDVPKTKEQMRAEKKAAKQAEKEAKKKAKEEERRQNELRQNRPPEVPRITMNPTLPKKEIVIAPDRKLDITHDKNVQRTRTKMVRKRVMNPDGTPSTHKVMKKVVYKGRKKTNGYRIQVFSGGNTREDRQNAQRVGHRIKAAFPDEPVYVHFYSPRWICRVGNFTDKKKAAAMLRKVKDMGFKSAIIVTGKISVRNAEYHDIE